MKKVDVITCFPEEFRNLVQFGLVGEALNKNIWQLNTINLRQFGEGHHRAIDDRPFGGADGMVITAPVLEKALRTVTFERDRTKFIYLSPQGKLLNQNFAQQLAQDYDHFVFLCGRYAGVDQRFLNYYSFEELSIGDYILTGGELAAAVTLDVLARHWEGVLGNQSSLAHDSLSSNPNLLETPLFTRPREWKGMSVPEVLLSGHHGKISLWQKYVGYLITFQKRRDLFEKLNLDPSERAKLRAFASQLSSRDRASLGLSEQTFCQLEQE